MTKPNAKVTTPPEGFEWTDEYRHVEKGEYFAHWGEVSGWIAEKWLLKGPTSNEHPIVVPIPKPLMVEIDRDTAQWMARRFWMAPQLKYIGEQCKAAIEAEG